tara:strand:+ start:1382 stop:2005 length:624 start_codon:yes stop_codon:yes gene_type:complete
MKDKTRYVIVIQNFYRKYINNINGLNINKLSKLTSDINFKMPPSQYDYYKKNNAPNSILKYVILPGKTFGEKYMERIAKEYFNFEKRENSSHDHIKNGKKIEQKSARFHSNGDDWKWQHIEMKHEWDYLLLAGLDFTSIRFYIASRKIVEELINCNIITGQGKKNDKGIAEAQQAYWFSRSDFSKNNKKFRDYFVPVHNESELISKI